MRSKSRFPRWALGCLLQLIAGAAGAGPGELDVRVGHAGQVDLPGWRVTGAASLPDGSVVVAGYQWPQDSATLVNPMPVQRVARIAPSGQVVWTRSFGSGFTNALHRLRSGRLLVGLSSYLADPGQLAALREDGSPDMAFGKQGKLGLDKRQIVTGAGNQTPGIAVESIRELPDDSLLLAATVADDTVATSWHPATLGIQFRLSATGELPAPPFAAADSLKGRALTAVEVLSDGRAMLLAEPGCCSALRTVLMASDGTGGLAEASVSADADWSPTALASDAAQSRFYALGTQGAVPTLAAIRADGTADPAFGLEFTGRASVSLPTARGRLWVDEGGSILSAVAMGEPAWLEPDLLKRFGARAEVFIEGWDFAGRTDSRFTPGRALPLTTSPGGSAARVVAMTGADPGFAWIVATVTGDSGTAGRLIKLQVGPGSGAGTLGFERTAIRIGEQGSSKTVRILRSGGSSGAVSVRYEILPIADGLVASSGTLSWADGDASPRTIELIPRDDELVQGERSQTVRLTDVQGGAALASEPLTVTIEDDDVLARLQVGVAAAQIRAGEVAEFRLALAQPVNGPVSVTVLVGDAVDGAGAPLFQNKNNSGTGYKTLAWPPGKSGVQIFRMGTNVTGDAEYAVDLQLRLVTDAGWLVRTPSGDALGATVRVVGGVAPIEPGHTGGVPAGPPSSNGPPSPGGSQGGGGATGLASLMLLACWLARCVARRQATGRSVCRNSQTPRIRLPSKCAGTAARREGDDAARPRCRPPGARSSDVAGWHHAGRWPA